MSIIALLGFLTIFFWVLFYLFVAGVLAYTLLTFWKFIVTVLLYGVIATVIIIIVGTVLLL